MKRVVTVVLVMAVLLVAAPWVIGNVAEARVNRSIDALVEAAPALAIVERKYTQGWFRSEQEVTFEVLGAVTRPFGASSRFTVRNEILHGPVLGLSGFGLVRVNSTLVLDPAIRRALEERFGGDELVDVSTRIGFLGGGTTTISSDERRVNFGNYASTGWDDLVIDVSWSADFDSIDVKGEWPEYDVGSPREWGFVRVEGATLDIHSRRVTGHLYETDAAFSIETIQVQLEDVTPTTVAKIQMVVDSSNDGDFMSVATRLGTGRIAGGKLEAQGLAFHATHCDVTVRRLHTGTLARIANAAAEATRHPAAVATAAVDTLDLLQHDPELVIDRIGLETKDGSAHLKGVIRLKGATAKDLRMGALSLIPRLDADLRFEASQKMIKALPGGFEAMMGAVDGGYAAWEDGNVVSHLEFHDGQLEINDKVSAIPGLGDPSSKEGAAGPE